MAQRDDPTTPAERLREIASIVREHQGQRVARLDLRLLAGSLDEIAADLEDAEWPNG